MLPSVEINTAGDVSVTTKQRPVPDHLLEGVAGVGDRPRDAVRRGRYEPGPAGVGADGATDAAAPGHAVEDGQLREAASRGVEG